jgi:hypothetical protein
MPRSRPLRSALSEVDQPSPTPDAIPETRETPQSAPESYETKAEASAVSSHEVSQSGTTNGGSAPPGGNGVDADSEEQARRVLAAVDRFAQQSETERLFRFAKMRTGDDLTAARLGLEPAAFEAMVNAKVKERAVAQRDEARQAKEDSAEERRRQRKSKSRAQLFHRLDKLPEKAQEAEIKLWCSTYEGEDPAVVAVEYKEYRGDVDVEEDTRSTGEAPWDGPVDGHALLNRIYNRIRRHVAITEKRAAVCAVWPFVAHSHEDVANHSPFLCIYGPEHESGKTTLLHIISWLSPQRRLVTKPTVSLYHATNRGMSIFVEEGRRLFEIEDLIDLIDSSYNRGVTITRIIKHEEREFHLFSPKAFTLLGSRKIISPATASRCWFVKLLPRKADETVDPFFFRDDPDLTEMRRMLARWIADHADTLRQTQYTVELPERLKNDRAADSWRLAIAIADLIGGDWPARIRAAALSVLPKKSDTTISWHRRAVADLRTYVDTLIKTAKGKPVEYAETSKFLAWLLKDPESEWHRYKGNRAVNQWDLTYLIRDNYEIGTAKVGKARRGGWILAEFAEIFERVLKNPLPTSRLPASRGSSTSKGRKLRDRAPRGPRR